MSSATTTCYLDDEIGRLLELLDDDTAVLVVSDHGAQRLDGGFCVNEWLVREGLLVLNEYPSEVTPFAELDVDWEQARRSGARAATTRGSSSTSRDASRSGVDRRRRTTSGSATR